MRSCISQFWQGGVLSPEYCGIKGRLGQPVRMRRVGVGREETEESRLEQWWGTGVKGI